MKDEYCKIDLGIVLNEKTKLYLYKRKSIEDCSKVPDILIWGNMAITIDDHEKSLPIAYAIHSEEKDWKQYIQSNYFNFREVKKCAN